MDESELLALQMCTQSLCRGLQEPEVAVMLYSETILTDFMMQEIKVSDILKWEVYIQT